MVNSVCRKCGKQYNYLGDFPEGGWPVGTAPYCTCNDESFKYVGMLTGFGTGNANMWQRCPICEGHDLAYTCRVCKGKKIISVLTGKPPK